MMLLDMELMARERHERLQREAAQANSDARQLAAGRPQQTNRPARLRFLSRR
ncbi:MAG: hypothetical protein QOJ81_1161 [Chloroflexota bacterium]|jgi:hypothetical protein|nr:hypothetical protein [Chloroflexota bacterium]